MKPPPSPPAVAAPHVTSDGVATYVDQLAAYEARRRAADDILLRKLANPLDPASFVRLS